MPLIAPPSRRAGRRVGACRFVSPSRFSFRFLRGLVFVRLLGGAPFFSARFLVLSRRSSRGVRFSRGGVSSSVLFVVSSGACRLAARSFVVSVRRLVRRLVVRFGFHAVSLLVSLVRLACSSRVASRLRLVVRHRLVGCGRLPSRCWRRVGGYRSSDVLVACFSYSAPLIGQPRFPGVAWGVACLGSHVVACRGGGYHRPPLRSRSSCLVPSSPRRIVIGSFRSSGPSERAVGACRSAIVSLGRLVGRGVFAIRYSLFAIRTHRSCQLSVSHRSLIAIIGGRHTREASAFHMGQLGNGRKHADGGG